MKVYISEEYFDVLESLLRESANDLLTKTPTNIFCIFQLLSSLPLKVDINDVKMKKYAKSIFNKSQPASFKDKIIALAIKNQKLVNGNFDKNINEYNAYYFINVDKNNDNIGIKNGVVLKDQNFDGNDFYADCTVTDQIISDDWSIIKNCIPPTNAMLIVDKFIFGDPFQIKLNSLISFINSYKSNELNIPFHLTILCSDEQKGKPICSQELIKRAFDALNEIPHIHFEINIQNKLEEKDRLFFTNYTKGNIGHPFTNRQTVFNQNFLGNDTSAEKIKSNYKDYKESLKKWQSIIKSIPEYTGKTKTKWFNQKFENRIFDWNN